MIAGQFRGLALSLLLASCDETNGSAAGPAPPVVVPDTPSTLTLQIGTGTTDFEPLQDGSVVSTTFGPQGGFHIWTAVRVPNPGLDQATVNLRAMSEERQPVGLPSSEAVRFVSGADGADAVGLRMFLFEQPPGARVVMRVEVVGRDGRHGEAEARVMIR